MHETPEYIAEAAVRVRRALNMPHARDLTMSTTAPAPEAAQRFACAVIRDACDAATDRAGLLARFWTERPRRLTCTACGDMVTLRGPEPRFIQGSTTS